MKAKAATLLLAIALAAAAIGLAACGQKSEDVTGKTEPLSLVLDFYPNPDHAGIYMAQKLGFFRDAGLDVSITAPTDPASPIQEVAAGRADIAISYEPEVLLAHEQGLDVKAVGALVDRPLTSLIWLPKSGVKRIANLRGKTIATAGIPYQNAFLQAILARAKLKTSDVKAVNVGLNLLPALLSGKAQAMLGGFSNVEGIDLRMRNKHPTVTPVDRLGVPSYDELVFVANASKLQENAQKIRLFLAAVARGTTAAAQKPNVATQAVLAANKSLDPKLTAAEVKATLPVLSQGTSKRPFGYMDEAQWQTFIGWMRDEGLISSLPAPSAVLSEEFLPGTIPN